MPVLSRDTANLRSDIRALPHWGSAVEVVDSGVATLYAVYPSNIDVARTDLSPATLTHLRAPQATADHALYLMGLFCAVDPAAQNASPLTGGRFDPNRHDVVVDIRRLQLPNDRDPTTSIRLARYMLGPTRPDDEAVERGDAYVDVSDQTKQYLLLTKINAHCESLPSSQAREAQRLANLAALSNNAIGNLETLLGALTDNLPIGETEVTEPLGVTELMHTDIVNCLDGVGQYEISVAEIIPLFMIIRGIKRAAEI